MSRTSPRPRPRRAAAPLLQTYRPRGGMGLGRAGRGRSMARTPFGRRRRTGHRGTFLFSLIAVCGALALFVWLWSRPVSLELTTFPSDAAIELSTGVTANGTLTVDSIDAGTYRATVGRAGFETRTVEVEARRFRGGARRVELDPLPQQLTVSVTPASATIRILRDGEEIATGTGSHTATIPAGAITLEASAKGRNPFERTLFLDGAMSMEIRLDPKGQVVHDLGVIGCAGAPKGVALTPDGTQAWTTILDGPPSIEIFEPVSGERIGEVDLGKHGAVEIVFSKDGSRAYASQMETAKVFEIDVATRKVIRGLKTGSAWTKVVALSPDDRTLYAANWSGDDVSEIDLDSGKLRRRIPVADTPRGLWPTADGKTLWVASFATGALERIDLKSGAVKQVFSSGGALRHLVADEKRGVLFASDMAKDCVWVTDMKTGKTKRFAKVGHKPNTIDLSGDGRVLFVSNRGANNSVSYYLPGPEWGSIMLLDATSAAPLDGIVGGNQCTALDVSDDGSTLVYSDFLDDRLRVYEIPTYDVLAAGGGGRSKTLSKDVRK